MTSFERVHARLEGRPVDKIPNLNIFMTFAAAYCKIPYSEFCLDYRKLVEANLACCEAFGADMLSTMSDPYREGHDYGMKIEFPYDDLPLCAAPLVNGPGDLRKLVRFDPLLGTRIADRIRAVELYRQQAGSAYSVLGWVECPFAEAVDLRGLTDIMYDLADDPEFVRELMEICLEQAVKCAAEQVKAGADFIGMGDAAASLIGADTYRELVLPTEQRLISAIHGMGAKTKLHICGNTGHLLDLLPQTQADIIDVDWMVSLEAAMKAFGDKCAANGNYDPVGVLLQGSAQDVAAAVRDCVRCADAAGAVNSFISAGCEVPKSTPLENLLAAKEALQT